MTIIAIRFDILVYLGCVLFFNDGEAIRIYIGANHFTFAITLHNGRFISSSVFDGDIGRIPRVKAQPLEVICQQL